MNEERELRLAQARRTNETEHTQFTVRLVMMGMVIGIFIGAGTAKMAYKFQGNPVQSSVMTHR